MAAASAAAAAEAGEDGAGLTAVAVNAQVLHRPRHSGGRWEPVEADAALRLTARLGKRLCLSVTLPADVGLTSADVEAAACQAASPVVHVARVAPGAPPRTATESEPRVDCDLAAAKCADGPPLVLTLPLRLRCLTEHALVLSFALVLQTHSLMLVATTQPFATTVSGRPPTRRKHGAAGASSAAAAAAEATASSAASAAGPSPAPSPVVRDETADATATAAAADAASAAAAAAGVAAAASHDSLRAPAAPGVALAAAPGGTAFMPGVAPPPGIIDGVGADDGSLSWPYGEVVVEADAVSSGSPPILGEMDSPSLALAAAAHPDATPAADTGEWSGGAAPTTSSSPFAGAAVGPALSPGSPSIAGDLTVNGCVAAHAFLQFSDERLKADIESIDDALGLVTQLVGRTFRWRSAAAVGLSSSGAAATRAVDGADDDDDDDDDDDVARVEVEVDDDDDDGGDDDDHHHRRRHRADPEAKPRRPAMRPTTRLAVEGLPDDGRRVVGLIAQEVREVLPEVVHEDPDTGCLSVAYAELVPVLVEAQKQLATQLAVHQALLARGLDHSAAGAQPAPPPAPVVDVSQVARNAAQRRQRWFRRRQRHRGNGGGSRQSVEGGAGGNSWNQAACCPLPPVPVALALLAVVALALASIVVFAPLEVLRAAIGVTLAVLAVLACVIALCGLYGRRR